ncbi:MAG: hypothetical protein ACNA74_07465 [Desulfurivibrio sp.]
MRVIFYAREDYPERVECVRAIRQVTADLPLDICPDQAQLALSLPPLWSGEAVAILLIADPLDLKAALLHQELLTNLPLILVLPDDDRETVRTGHQLRPRFVGFHGNDFSEITAVLKRVLARFSKSRN